MVEVRLESLDPGTLPQDCYVSVRLGETQKLSKLTGLRTLRFPGSKDWRLGKIEVFKRVGACSIDVNPAANTDREVRIACDSNVGELGLRVHLETDAMQQGAVAATKQEAQTQSEASKGAKMQAYKEYLGKHGLEVMLSEAMSAVLRQRPDQPVDFLVEHLKHCRSFPVVEKPVLPVVEKPAPSGKGNYYATNVLPQVGKETWNKIYAGFPQAKRLDRAIPESALAPPPVTEARTPAVQQAQAPAAKQTPLGEGTYYATNVLPQVDKETWSGLYAGFPQARTPERAVPKSAPAPSPAMATAATAPACMSASVGTWLVSKRRAPGPINPVVPMLLPCAAARSPVAAADASVAAPVVAPAPAASTSSASSAGAAAPWPLRPSVGTWLAVAPRAPKAAVCRAPPSVATVARQAAAEPAATVARWPLKPSVGTWLAVRLGDNSCGAQ